MADPLLDLLGVTVPDQIQTSAKPVAAVPRQAAAPMSALVPAVAAQAQDPLLTMLGVEVPKSAAPAAQAQAPAPADQPGQQMVDEWDQPYRQLPGSLIRVYDDTDKPQKVDPNITRITISGTAPQDRSAGQAGMPDGVRPEAGLASDFGERLQANIEDIPRQAGLTVRHGIEGVGDALNFMATPIRWLGNGMNYANDKLVTALGFEDPHHQMIQPVNFSAIADSLGLPKSEGATERIVGDALRTGAGALVPMGAGKALANSATGVTQAVGRMLAQSPAMQVIGGAASGAAGSYTRETGGGPGAQILASIAGGVLAPMAASGAQRAAGAVQGAARRLFDDGTLAAQAAAKANALAEQTVNSAIKDSGLTFADLPFDVQNGIRSDVQKALATGENLSPDALKRLADYRLTGTTPTAATLSLDPVAVTQQKNLAKLGASSKDVAAQKLAQVENANNRQLITGLNNLGAAAEQDAVSNGGTVIDALMQRNNQAQGLIDARYAAARANNGRSALLDHEAFVQRANELLDQNMLGGKVPGDVRKLLNRDWTQVVQPQEGSAASAAAEGVNRNVFDVQNVEQMKRTISDLQRISTNGPEIKALGLVRQALDEAPLVPGQEIGQEAINQFNQAREAHRQWMKIVEQTPALQAVRAGADPDKFVQDFIIRNTSKASSMAVEQLKNQIADNQEAMTAVRRQITSYLKSVALNGATDEAGNFSQSSYNKALNAIGDRKLRLFFPAEDIAQLKAIGRVASYEQFQPRGSAVNNSNTASASWANLLDRLGNSSFLSKVPLAKALQEPVQNIAVGMKSRAALDAPQSLVTPAQRAKSAAVPMSALLPGLLMLHESQQQDEQPKGLLTP